MWWYLEVGPRKWLDHKVVVLMNGINNLIKRLPRTHLVFQPCEDRKKVTINSGENLPDMESARSLIFDFQDRKPLKNKCSLFKPSKGILVCCYNSPNGPRERNLVNFQLCVVISCEDLKVFVNCLWLQVCNHPEVKESWLIVCSQFLAQHIDSKFQSAEIVSYLNSSSIKNYY